MDDEQGHLLVLGNETPPRRGCWRQSLAPTQNRADRSGTSKSAAPEIALSSSKTIIYTAQLVQNSRVLIVLDSNAFHKNFRCEGPYFTSLLRHVRRTTDKLYVPQVVIDEVVNQFRETAEGIMPSVKTLDKLIKSDINNLASAKLVAAVRDYREWLTEHLSSDGCSVEPYPKTSHQEIVARDLSRRKPFARSGKGYRDYLIWLTLLSLLKGGEEVAFVTTNSTDFGAGELHSDLLNDLQDLQFQDEQVLLLDSLKELQEKVIKPSNRDEVRQATLEDIRVQLENDQHYLHLEAWLDENGLEYVQDEYDAHDIGLEYDDTCWVVSVQSISDLQVSSVSDLSDNEMLIEFSAEMELEVELTLRYGDFFSLSDSTEFSVTDLEDGAVTGTDSATVTAAFALIYDAGTAQVTKVELVSIEP